MRAPELNVWLWIESLWERRIVFFLFWSQMENIEETKIWTGQMELSRIKVETSNVSCIDMLLAVNVKFRWVISESFSFPIYLLLPLSQPFYPYMLIYLLYLIYFFFGLYCILKIIKITSFSLKEDHTNKISVLWVLYHFPPLQSIGMIKFPVWQFIQPTS